MTIIWYGFKCPNNHFSLINEKQGEGLEGIVCGLCNFRGFVLEGRRETKYEEHDYMGALKG